ncbi:hypothetical protein CCACVL1_19667 [Corchorus capsularis]|uniref:Uncharacterized protein n=1 Tax=Corchorus capsularis TaxID=210143 RepID=A0A1R3HFD1_COCAP|nr:hypothetical protein CCACVL1_19667 [Corchorus capsularis]
MLHRSAAVYGSPGIASQWSPPHRNSVPPPIDAKASILDFRCLVNSSPVLVFQDQA